MAVWKVFEHEHTRESHLWEEKLGTTGPPSLSCSPPVLPGLAQRLARSWHLVPIC